MSKCAACNSTLVSSQRVYCSNKCQGDYAYRMYIAEWRDNKVDGARGINTRTFSGHIRRYLFEKYRSACSICGWKKKNSTTGVSPLEIDHIDGDSENNQEDNLRLICPNCHALTPNYKNSNRGHGRGWRRLKYIRSV